MDAIELFFDIKQKLAALPLDQAWRILDALNTDTLPRKKPETVKPPPNETAEWLSVPQVAKAVGAHPASVYDKVKKGKLPHEIRDGQIKMKRSDVSAYRRSK